MSGLQSQSIWAAVYREGRKNAAFERLAVKTLAADEVLVRLVATGICHTDLTCCDGFMALPRPMILGHEGAGIVAAIGTAVTMLAVGDPVVLSFAHCGDCGPCRRGAPAYCEQFVPGNLSGRRLDGSTAMHGDEGDVSAHFFGQSSFASHSVVRAASAIKVRRDAPLELLGPLGCGIQTGAGSVLNVLSPEPGSAMAIFGAGGVGLSAVMAAAVAGCGPIIAIEPHPERRALALTVGATHAIDPAEADVVAAIHAITGGGANCAIDTSGVPAVIGQAIAALAALGKIALITAGAIDATLPGPLLPMLMRGITIRGVSMGDSVPAVFIPELVDLFMADRFPIDRLVRFYDFADLDQAMSDLSRSAVIKPILRMSDAG